MSDILETLTDAFNDRDADKKYDRSDYADLCLHAIDEIERLQSSADEYAALALEHANEKQEIFHALKRLHDAIFASRTDPGNLDFSFDLSLKSFDAHNIITKYQEKIPPE